MGRPPKPADKKKKRISITLEPKLVEQLKEFAEREGKSLSEYIEEKLKDRVSWDIREFGRFIQAINVYNGYTVEYTTGFLPNKNQSIKSTLHYHLHRKTLSIEFPLKNSKGWENLHKATIEFGWCPDCPGPYITLKLYGWDEKKKQWFEMGEESFFDFNGEKLFNAILSIRRDYWLKFKFFQQEKKKK
jgi:hypothetical protein